MTYTLILSTSSRLSSSRLVAMVGRRRTPADHRVSVAARNDERPRRAIDGHFRRTLSETEASLRRTIAETQRKIGETDAQ